MFIHLLLENKHSVFLHLLLFVLESNGQSRVWEKTAYQALAGGGGGR
jgi:hypothetical protein